MPYSRGWFKGPYDIFTILKLVLLALGVIVFLNALLAHPTLFTATAVILAVLTVLAVAHVVITVLRVQFASRWGPTRSVPATVTRKWTTEHDYGLPVGGPVEHALADALDEDSVPTIYEHWNFYLSFDVGTGDEEEFLVPESLYQQTEEGATGVLTYRGERLLSFVAEEAGGRP